jgi:aspartyl/asparaginyl beta-hydroxylase (cupin superfamily)
MAGTRAGGATLSQAGFDALRRGDAARARERFREAIASGEDQAPVHVGLAYACRALKDAAGFAAAVDRALELDARSLHALILKGDQLAATGDERGASSFYRTALSGAPPPEQLGPELRRELARVQQACDVYAARFEESLRASLRSKGFGDAAGRFGQSLDIMFGRRQVYYQQPRRFYFAELPQVQFFDRASFPWMEELERATGAIRAELIEVMREDSSFAPYVEADPSRPRTAGSMVGNPDWSAFYLWKYGERVEANAARCPRTMEAIAKLPLVHMRGRSPSVLFSLLKPGAHIPPHTGLVNTRCICHLPLIVPERCEFRVGNETRPWVEGRAWAFDDTIEHEAWNRSRDTRVILLFEVWRPELTDDERARVCATFEAIDEYGGDRQRWEI